MLIFSSESERKILPKGQLEKEGAIFLETL
jgi:hypothetical protein